jgi:oxalate decarboxylase
MARAAQQTETTAQPIRDGTGATIMGPRNVPLERENPDLLASPYSDSGTIPNLKFSFAAARNRLITGGWAREAHLNLDQQTMAALRKDKPIIVAARH